MSSFEVPVVRVTKVEHHPNADRLSLVYFRGFTTISAKLEDGSHRYNEGDLVVYVPEGAVVPEYLLRQGFWDDTKNKGMLTGPKGDRVKAIRLRGIISQGIMFPVEDVTLAPNPEGWVVNEFGEKMTAYEGTDVAEHLGVIKYEPPIPVQMAGEVFNLGADKTIKFDVENYQKFPHVMNDPNEDVVVTEKLHGTFCQIAYLPGEHHPDGFLTGDLFIGSKGMSAQGLMFKNNERNASNLYVRAVIGSGIAEAFKLACEQDFHGTDVYLLGEVFGQGVQDLTYGSKGVEFRAFAVKLGKHGRWLNNHELGYFLDKAGIARVPVLAQGPWLEVERNLVYFRDGKTTLGGDHIREGVVITPTAERRHDEIGRVILKAVSPDYLLRKGNVTEFA